MVRTYRDWLQHQLYCSLGDAHEAYRLALEKLDYYEKAELIYDRLVNCHVRDWRKRNDKNSLKYWIHQANINGEWKMFVDIDRNEVTYSGQCNQPLTTVTLEQFYDMFEPDEYYH